MIVRLDPSDAKHRRAAAALHGTLLPESPIACLGRLFMDNFYYDRLIRDGLVHCDLYEREGRFTAFASYTKRPFSFMEEGKKKHFVYLSALLLASVAARPARMGVILETLRLGARRCRSTEKDTAELLSFGVEPDSASFRDPASGKKVPNLMFERVRTFFRDQGFSKVRFIVRKDNHASLLFFNSYGAEIESEVSEGAGMYLMSVLL